MGKVLLVYNVNRNGNVSFEEVERRGTARMSDSFSCSHMLVRIEGNNQ